MMSTSHSDELNLLLVALTDSEIDRRQFTRLQTLLSQDPDAQAYFRRYMRLCALLEFERAAAEPVSPDAANELHPIGAAIELPRQVEMESAIPSPLPSVFHSRAPSSPDFVGGPVFSYMVATVFMCLLLFGFWLYKLPPDRGSSIASNENSRRSTTSGEESIHDRPAPVVVGRITGIAGAKWSDEPNYIAPLGVGVALGRQYKLKSGLLEITYDSGAKVILEGPCSYEVDSAAGGYLALGKLVARVASDNSRRLTASGNNTVMAQTPEAVSLRLLSESTNPQIHSPLATNPSPLFTVRTPTAVVTDLGTEFGIVVGEDGNTISHVFAGMVKVKSLAGASLEGLILHTNESVSVGPNSEQIIDLGREEFRDATFTRRMPRRAAIKVFSTGVGLNEGDYDPHWQIVARSDEPDFKPRLAMVTASHMYWPYNLPTQSQWISIADGPPELPDGVTFTFRTTFQLSNVLPAGCSLRGRFLVDNHVGAIRLNGKECSVPKHDFEAFAEYNDFEIADGFVEGTNVLEIDVYNGRQEIVSGETTGMALRVELQGTALHKGSDSPPASHPKRTEKIDTTYGNGGAME
ncbi:MAG: FecR domain-containing protein [Pirellulaceae bacterium]|nr:FecR domain-containing protein [Pirellulaceae bacterium]